MYLRFTVGLDSLGLVFHTIGAEVIAANSSLSASQVGAGVAVAGLEIQNLALITAIGVCLTCRFWVSGHVRVLNVFQAWKKTKGNPMEDAGLMPTKPLETVQIIHLG
jgi:hypothetical protein